MKYLGIGTDDTPPAVLSRMTTLGALLGVAGHELRATRARKPDLAFEDGNDAVKGQRRIRCETLQSSALAKAAEIYNDYTPDDFNALDEDTRAMCAAYVLLMLGDKFDDPVDCVITWYDTSYFNTAYLPMACYIAGKYDFPVFNLQVPEDEAALWQWVSNRA